VKTVTRVNTTAVVTAITIAVLGVGTAGCNGAPSSPTAPLPGVASSSSASSPSSTSTAVASAQPIDYTRLLIKASDILAPDDSYTAQPATLNPNGTQGAQVLFVNHDQTRAIGVSLVILSDAAAASSTLQAFHASLATSVTGGDPQPSPAGTGGTVVSGMSPDQSKAVTILLFCEGRAFVRLEFDSAPGLPISADFVTDIGDKQDIALRSGLPG
jgi:hypothetical protein